MTPDEWDKIYRWPMGDARRSAAALAMLRARKKYGSRAAVRCFLAGEGGRVDAAGKPIPTYEVGELDRLTGKFVVAHRGRSWAEALGLDELMGR